MLFDRLTRPKCILEGAETRRERSEQSWGSGGLAPRKIVYRHALYVVGKRPFWRICHLKKQSITGVDPFPKSVPGSHIKSDFFNQLKLIIIIMIKNFFKVGYEIIVYSKNRATDSYQLFTKIKYLLFQLITDITVTIISIP